MSVLPWASDASLCGNEVQIGGASRDKRCRRKRQMLHFALRRFELNDQALPVVESRDRCS